MRNRNILKKMEKQTKKVCCWEIKNGEKMKSIRLTHAGKSLIRAKITSFSLAVADALATSRLIALFFLQYSRVTAKITGVISHATDQFMYPTIYMAPTNDTFLTIEYIRLKRLSSLADEVEVDFVTGSGSSGRASLLSAAIFSDVLVFS